VVDFIDMQWWPIFNIADMGVTIGAVLFAIAALRAPAAPSGRAA
jgi:signal peptidase II